MTALPNAVLTGVHRGWIEFRHGWGQAFNWAFFPLIGVIVMFVLRDSRVPGTDFSLGSQAIPGLLALTIVLTGVLGVAVALVTEREDGTLLRARAVPHGVLGYLIGKVAGQALLTLASLLVVLVPAALLFDGLRLDQATAWATLLGVVVLGLLATLPLGAILGSLFRSMQSMQLAMILVMALGGVSGVFYPLTALPTWLQTLAQAFPLYWLGLGARAALLPEALAAAEIGGSWRPLPTVAVLTIWILVGLGLAPTVLRRMARRPAGSPIDDQRRDHDRATQQ